MAIVPSTKQDKVAFYLTHAPIWTAATTTIGLTAADCTAITTLANAASAAFAAKVTAKNAYRTAVEAYDDAVAAMAKKGSTLIQKVKSTAAASANPGAVYQAAQIPSPALPTPVGDPGTPYGLKATLNPDGSITVTWKCDNPAGSVGTIYNLRRKLGTGGTFASIGGTGVREFTDQTIPAGTASVIYEITAVRSTRTGTAAEFVVNFGVSNAGEAFATVTPPSAAKLAA